MNNKILIGSIIAGAVLIGVSFTSVVGYRSVASDMKASPLFNIRSSRAVEKESWDLSCTYVGKGDECILAIPKRDNRTILVQQTIDGIRKMNEEEFNQFVLFTINKLLCDNKIKEKNIPQLKNLLIHLRNLPEGFFETLNFRNENHIKLQTNDLCWLTVTPIVCLIFLLFTIFIFPILWLFEIILEFIYIFLYIISVNC